MVKKLKISIVVLVVAALLAPAGMADVTYSATVTAAGQSTSVVVNNALFGSIAKGASKTLPSSLTLNNTGDTDAKVTVKFTTNVSTTFGLTNGSNVLPAANFELGTTGNLVPLNSDGSGAALGTLNNVPFGSSVNYDAKLSVPLAQPAGSYSGNVQIIFANAP